MSSAANQEVSVVILTKNSARTITRCLESVVEQRPGEILAVDALSKDGTLAILKRYDAKILTDDVGSLGYARQAGVEAAKGSYVMFVDSDVVLGTDCIQTMLSDLGRYGWSGVHARLLSAENISYWQRAEDKTFLRYYGRVSPRARIDTICTLFRREVLLRCPFDAGCSVSSEDVDLCRRLMKMDYTLGVSRALAYHYHRCGFPAFARQRFRSGLGRANLGLKYRQPGLFVDPLVTIISAVIRSVISERGPSLVPYYVVSELARFSGVVVGLSRAQHKSRKSSRKLPDIVSVVR